MTVAERINSGNPRYLGLDFETYSSVDLGKCGAFAYMDSDDFEPLLLAYAYDDEPVRIIDFTDCEGLPQQLVADMTDPNVIKCAANTQFERNVFRVAFGIESPVEQWLDSLTLGAYCGLPLRLAQVSEALELSEDKAKMAVGSQLIKKFCLPRKPTKTNPSTRVYPWDAPDDWEMFKTYCMHDVEAEREIRHRLGRWLPPPEEFEFYALDAKINERGIKYDKELATNAVAMNTRYTDDLLEQAARISGLDNPKSVSQIKDWLKEQEGLEVVSLNKKVIADVVSGLESGKAKEFMALRSEFSKSSVAKYDAMLRSGSPTDHIRGCFVFYGAHTGRFAGRLVQLQNLSKNKAEDIDFARTLVKEGDYETLTALFGGVSSILSELVRPTLIAEENSRFLVADYAAIEARVIAWVAGEQWRLDAFRDGKDIYCASASRMFGVPVEKHGQNADLRSRGKVAELGLGYGGGINALKAFGADKMGLSDEEMVGIVDQWRAASPRIVALWKSLENAAIKAIVRKTSTISTIGDIPFSYESGVLWMTLPSGRRMAYWDARYEESQMPHKHGKVISYTYINDKKKLARLETWGGKLTENLIQAIARDCLRTSMLALDSEGYDIRAHVHDEVIITEPYASGRTVKDVCEVMGREVPWAPGLLLRGDGYETPYYIKD